jgi:LysR family transcriptional activator of nhaA
LLETFAGKTPARRSVLRIGAMATLSRNFQLDFIRPLLASHDVEVVLRSGNLRGLLVQLEAYGVDVILSIELAQTDAERTLNNYLIAEYPVSLFAARNVKMTREKFSNNLRHTSLVLPGKTSSMRAVFTRAALSTGGRARSDSATRGGKSDLALKPSQETSWAG